MCERTIRRPRSERSQAGQAIVEFAMVGATFMFLLMSVIDLGRGVMAQNSISHAAREGAHTALYYGATDAQVRQVVKAQAQLAPSLTDAQIVITPSGSRDAGVTVMVSVSYIFEPITPMMSALVPGGLALSADAKSIVQ